MTLRKIIFLALLLSLSLDARPVEITILGTNDIHGGVEPHMPLWAAKVKEIRSTNSNVLLVDAGDQYQGTLISNFNEGRLVYSIMKHIGYDAVVPGNHAYDFGPIGWLVDQSFDPAKRREALERNAKETELPLVSANTFYQNSMLHPDYVKPYVIKEVSGVRVALIGIDFEDTPHSTTPDNVADLYFGNEQESYLKVRQKLEGQADVFVLVVHDGDSQSTNDLTRMIKGLTEPKRWVDAVVSGHTHNTYNFRINGVPVIQSGSGGGAYGRIDLVWDSEAKQIDLLKSKSEAGIPIKASQPDVFVKKLVDDARVQVDEIAKKPIGKAERSIKRNYFEENAMANNLTDALRRLTGADIAFLNGGGQRANLNAGILTYEDLFKVMPFSNRAFLVGPISKAELMKLLERSIRTCGAYGALFPSGIRATFKRDCSNALATGGIDPNAKIVTLELPQGKDSFTVAIPDFLAAGGGGFMELKGLPVIRDFGLMRELLVNDFVQTLPVFADSVDGRWKVVN